MWQRGLRILGILLCAGALLGTSQCQQQDDKTDGSPVFVTTLALQDANGNVQSSFTSGQTVVLKLTVYNRSDAVQTFWFATSQQYNFAVVSASTANVVWCWAAQKFFAQVFTSLSFQPYETQSFTANWNQTDNNGIPLPAGQYEALGGLTMYNRGGVNDAEDNSDAMAGCAPQPSQMAPTQYRSDLLLFNIN